MFNRSQRHLLTRAGTGAAVVALVALTGYGVGQTQSANSTVAAAPTITRTIGSDTIPAGSYASIVSAAAPAVVTVRVDKKATMVPTQGQDDPFGEFFGRRFQNPQQRRTPRQSGLGSGVVTTADGYILTNNHVIEGADTVRVEFTDRRTFDAKVIGADPASDLAVIKIEASNLKTLPLGDSNRVQVGDVVLAIGNPLGVGQTVTMGIVSAKGRATGVGDGSYEDFLQTDAAINQGNSGGALISTSGELVGINSQILTPTGGNIGLGFAIPSNMAKQVMDQLRTDGKVVRGKLGVTIQNVTSDMAASLNLPEVGGAIVSGVESGSAAEKAGLKQGDIIVGVNGEKILDNNTLRNRIASTRPGSSISLDVLRDGKTQTIKATVDQLQGDRNQRGSRDTGAEGGGYGMTVEPLTPEVARSLELTRRTEGVVITNLAPDGIAATAGLQEGDVIVQVNGRAVKTGAELKSALDAASGKPALLLVARKDAEVFVTLKK